MFSPKKQITPFTRTKIIASIGPASNSEEVITELIKAGVDVIRLNFSHGDAASFQPKVELIRKINKKLGTHVAVLQDLQGPKIRIGVLKHDIALKTGDILRFRTDIKEHQEDLIPIQYVTFAKDVKVGDRILADDGNIELCVLETDGEKEVKLRVEYGEVLKSKKGVNLPFTHVGIPTITKKDLIDYKFAIKNNVEWIALSFVRTAGDITMLKSLIRAQGGDTKVIAKIEKPEALENLDEIIAASDAIMVARGDLGVEVPLEDVPAWQKQIIRRCNKATKPVIVATQVMESMIENHRPTRAEASDVANAVQDGADAIMLSGETSVGKYPVVVVESVKRILASSEKIGGDFFYRNMNVNDDLTGDERLSRAVITTACKLAEETGSKGIVGMTFSGYTAFQLASCRPKSPIFIFTGNKRLLNTLSLVWGVRAFYYDNETSTDKTIKDVHEILKISEILDSGDIVINTASMPIGKHGLTNMVKISRVG